MRQTKEIDREIVIHRVHTSRQLKWNLHLPGVAFMGATERLLHILLVALNYEPIPFLLVAAAADIG